MSRHADEMMKKFIDGLYGEELQCLDSAETLCIMLNVPRIPTNYRTIIDMLMNHRREAKDCARRSIRDAIGI